MNECYMCVVKRSLDGACIYAHAPSSTTYGDRRGTHIRVGRKVVIYLSLGLERCHIPIESRAAGHSFTREASDVRRAFGYDGDLIACRDHAHTYTQPRVRVS